MMDWLYWKKQQESQERGFENAQTTTLNGRCKNMHSKSLHSTNQASFVRRNKRLDNLIKKEYIHK